MLLATSDMLLHHFFLIQAGGSVAISLDFTEVLKSKSLYVMRKKPVAISKNNYRYVLTVGDISATTFGQLSSFLNEVCFFVSIELNIYTVCF